MILGLLQVLQNPEGWAWSYDHKTGEFYLEEIAKLEQAGFIIRDIPQRKDISCQPSSQD